MLSLDQYLAVIFLTALFFTALIIFFELITNALTQQATDVILTKTYGGQTMIVDKEFDITEGQTATLKIHPVNDVGGDARVENVDFSVDNPDLGQLGVDPTNPLVFQLVIPLNVSGDLTLNLKADGHIGEGVSEIDKTYIAHVKSKDAVDIQLDVSINP